MILRDAIAVLSAAGVASPEYDARELLAHVTGSSRMLLAEPTPAQAAEFALLIERRAAREPLQHLTGVAHFRYVELSVGPGVFVPRPETELLAGWAISQVEEVAKRPSRDQRPPVVVDLCTGSGAIAAAIKDEAPRAEVHAVELNPDSIPYARANLTEVDLRVGDAFAELDDLLGTVDVITCNPPYIPLEAWESVAPEARDHDPHLALFSGQDGLDAIRLLERRATALLRPGGVIGVEHADAQGESAPAVFAATGRWEEVRDHRDLADRPRFLTARLAGAKMAP